MATAARDEGRACSVALSGGSTPRRLFALLASEDWEPLPWENIHLFWGDERHVGPDHPDSNYRMTVETLLDGGLVPQGNVHRIPSENPDAAAAALAYAAQLRGFFAVGEGRFPRFDLVILGMGADGHTASLFPGTPVLNENSEWVAATWVEKLAAHRITLTPPLFNHARRVLFLVTGADKAATLREVLHGQRDPHRYPAQLIEPVDGTCRWLLDTAAAAEL